MPCHAPLNHSGGNRLSLRGCITAAVSCPQNWPLPTRSPKTGPAKPGPPLPRTLCFRTRAVLARSVASPHVRPFTRATRSEHQRSRERHIARCRFSPQGQNIVALCRNCDCRGNTVEFLAKRGRILPLTGSDVRRCTTMSALRNPEVPRLRCVSIFPKKIQVFRKKERARLFAPCSVRSG